MLASNTPPITKPCSSCGACGGSQHQFSCEPGRRIEPPAKVEKAEPAPPKRPRPRISVKPKGGTGSAIGDDKAGGGPPTAESSKGGTPGTPSGSFTGAPPRP